jgi:NAD-dependent dihydropyrimidine dehydrogenase PreA subunit
VAEEKPLREVVREITACSQQLDALDGEISVRLRLIQDKIKARRSHGYPVDVAFPPWGKLGWSGRRGRWRFVVIDDDECDDLLSMPRECRAEACLVLPKLVERLLPVSPL